MRDARPVSYASKERVPAPDNTPKVDIPQEQDQTIISK
jgi:hypothetical protein